jgi:hypothetical protein
MGGTRMDRRALLAAAPVLLAAIASGDKAGATGDITLAPPPESGPDPAETFVQLFQDITFEPWGKLPPHSGEMAKLYGDFDKPGPYLVLMKWNPGWFSAPHTYATDRIQVVVFGTWFVNSGNDFRPEDAVPVGPGGYVHRTARTPHYDGVPAQQTDPAVIAIFGLGPVDVNLIEPSQPSWRQV